MSEKLTKDDIRGLANSIIRTIKGRGFTIDFLRNAITEWQTPEKDVLEGEWHSGGDLIRNQVWTKDGSIQICHCDDEDLEPSTKDRIARAIAQIPQMYKFCTDILGGHQYRDIKTVAREILAAIDNKN